jgi:hypothetical protein
VHRRRASIAGKNKHKLLHVLTCMAWAGNGVFFRDAGRCSEVVGQHASALVDFSSGVSKT